MNGIGIFSRPELETQTAKTASFTAEAGKSYPVDLSSVTADIVLTFPSSPSTDDKFSVHVSATHSSGGTSTAFTDRPFFCVEPANATSINGTSYSADAGEGSGTLGLWVVGDRLTFTYTGSTWLADQHLAFHDTDLTKSGTTSISNNSLTVIPFETEAKDNAALHSTSTNTSRVTIKRAGEYLLNSNVIWGSNSTDERFARFITNGSTQTGADRKQAFTNSESLPTRKVTLSARDYVEIQVRQKSGSALDISSGTVFTVTELR